jgi:outer membrane protein assembly factor BamA
LAFPSYLLHWTTRPIGWGVKWAERKLPQLFQGERGYYGIYPLFELGGNTTAAYGLLFYHNKFSKFNHNLRLEALFGSEDYNDFDFEYTIPNFLSAGAKLQFDASYSNDPIESLYGGNSANLADEQLYATEIISGRFEYWQPLSKHTNLSIEGGYQNTEINATEQDEDDEFIPSVPQSLQKTTSLASLATTVRFDFVEGTPRTFSGSRYIAKLGWHHSLTNNQHHYLNYSLQWHQFIPLGFLPNSRRLAFKSSLQKTEPLGDKKIPFYNYPSLGSSRDLRGFPSDRFRDDGSLLLTLEYRYPMWDFADVVFFIDEGQVFSRYSDIAINDFHSSYGFGFHLISTKGFAFRSEFAFSKESSRVILSITPNF